jgi:hypothetical protein
MPTALKPNSNVPGSGTLLTGGGGLLVSGGGLPVSGGGGGLTGGGGSTGGSGGSTMGGSGLTATGGTVVTGLLGMMNADAVDANTADHIRVAAAVIAIVCFVRLFMMVMPSNPVEGSQNAHDRTSCQEMIDRTMPKS